MATYWTNSDGLTVRFGTYEGEANNMAAAVNVAGVEQELVMDIVGTSLTDAGVPAQLSQAAAIPANSLITSSTLIVDTAFVGDTAVLDIGTYQSDGTVIDDDGLHAAVAVASLTADTDLAGAGAQVGTVVAQDCYVAATYDTAAFTAGTAKLVVRYIKQ